MILFICGILKKKIQMKLFTKQKQSHREQTYGHQVRRVRGRDRLGDWGRDRFRFEMYTLLYLK